MRTFIAVFFSLVICHLVVSVNSSEDNIQLRGKGGSVRQKKRFDANHQKYALEMWASSLTEKDYNYTEWRIMYRSKSTSDFFNGYAKKLSNIFRENEAKVNFALVGACDGTGDNTIKHIYLPNDHWRGVFVEPMSLNVRDLHQFVKKHQIEHRSIVIAAAATEKCVEPTIKIERPLYEEKNDSTPHWLRRQINSILPAHRDHARPGWQVEEVRCMTAEDILNEWTAVAYANKEAKFGRKADAGASKKKRRPHVLKIDVEGHDYDVLMSFLKPDTPVTDLPLLIDFEAKSIGKMFPVAKEKMEALGYAVSPFAQDGFAILKADKIFDSIALLFSPEAKEARGSGGGKSVWDWLTTTSSIADTGGSGGAGISTASETVGAMDGVNAASGRKRKQKKPLRGQTTEDEDENEDEEYFQKVRLGEAQVKGPEEDALN